MAFTLTYPKDNDAIQPTAIVFGQLSPNVTSVTGRMISYAPSTIVYAVRMDQLAPRFWRLVFVGLTIGDTYDLEIRDQNGRLVGGARNLSVVPLPANITITYPLDGDTVCPDLIVVGTTTNPGTSLDCIKAQRGGNTYNGAPDLIIGNSWSVIFNSPPLPEGNGYTIRIGHEANCSDAQSIDVNVSMAACNPNPDEDPDEDPLPDDPMPPSP